MKNVKLDIAKTGIEISADIEAKAQAANALLHSGKGAGNDFLGWVRLPSSISENEIDAIQKEAAKLRSKADVVVCIGIGGSYLGAKAVLEAMSDPFKLLHKEQKDPTVIFAGQNVSEDYTAELLAALKEHSIAAIVISKSGTTTEPAIAFRLIKAEIEKRYGKKEAAERIVAITDKARGALKTLATQEGYPTFVIPDDVGGRFSVLTPVGHACRWPSPGAGHRGPRPRRAGDGEGHGRRRAFRGESGSRLRRRAQHPLRRRQEDGDSSVPTA